MFNLLRLQVAVLSGSDVGSDGVEPALRFVPEPLDLGIHVVPNVWGTLLGRGLRFIQWHNYPVKERDPICRLTNEIPQHQSAGD